MSESQAPISSLPVKHTSRFVTLDAMRGVTAFMVIWFHLGGFHWVWQPRFAYLSVDLFFALSGFVLVHANKSRFAAGMSISDFMLRRAIRLLPLYLVGLSIGLILMIIKLRHLETTISKIAETLLPNLFLLPSIDLSGRLFPSDGPAWSLFLEFWVANLGLALMRKHLTLRMLGPLILIGLAGLGWQEHVHYKLDLGSRWTTAAGGLARVVFSFSMGVALAQLHARHPCHLRIPAWMILVLLVGLLSTPIVGRLARMYELGCVGLAFPIFIYLGSSALERRPWLGTALGDTSYGVYIIHAPVLEILDRLSRSGHHSPGIAAAVLFTVFIFACAYTLDRFYDIPSRLWLSRLLVRPQSKYSTRGPYK